MLTRIFALPFTVLSLLTTTGIAQEWPSREPRYLDLQPVATIGR
jgi:hypothetical protein